MAPRYLFNFDESLIPNAHKTGKKTQASIRPTNIQGMTTVNAFFLGRPQSCDNVEQIKSSKLKTEARQPKLSKVRPLQ